MISQSYSWTSKGPAGEQLSVLKPLSKIRRNSLAKNVPAGEIEPINKSEWENKISGIHSRRICQMKRIDIDMLYAVLY